MKELHIKRLRKLATHMNNLSARQIRMDKFFNACGTPACVLGHATRIKEFREDGLHAVVAWKGGPLNVKYRGQDGEFAGKSFFGLDFDEAMAFFGMTGRAYGSSRPTPKKVAKRLRELIQEKTAA